MSIRTTETGRRKGCSTRLPHHRTCALHTAVPGSAAQGTFTPPVQAHVKITGPKRAGHVSSEFGRGWPSASLSSAVRRKHCQLLAGSV